MKHSGAGEVSLRLYTTSSSTWHCGSRRTRVGRSITSEVQSDRCVNVSIAAAETAVSRGTEPISYQGQRLYWDARTHRKALQGWGGCARAILRRPRPRGIH